MAVGFSISDYLEDKLLDKILRDTDFTVSDVYASMHDGHPYDTGSNESNDAGYARQLVTFTTAVDGISYNSNRLKFGPFTTPFYVQGIGLWDAVSSGNCLWLGAPWRGQFGLGYYIDDLPASPYYVIEPGSIAVGMTSLIGVELF